MLRSFFRTDPLHREPGATIVEYMLLVALAAIVLIGILTILSERVSRVYSHIGSDIREVIP